MKGYSATSIIGIIVAVVIAVFIIYLLWAKGIGPFSGGLSEAQCHTNLQQDCDRAFNSEWSDSSIKFFSNLKTCDKYYSLSSYDKAAFDCCTGNNMTQCLHVYSDIMCNNQKATWISEDGSKCRNEGMSTNSYGSTDEDSLSRARIYACQQICEKLK